MGQHKIAAHNHGQKPTTHKPRIGQFNQSRSNMVHVSAEIVGNTLKTRLAKEITETNDLAAQYGRDNNMVAFDRVNRELGQLRAQYNAMPDRIVGKRSTYAIGANQAKQYRKIIKGVAKRDRRAARRT